MLRSALVIPIAVVLISAAPTAADPRDPPPTGGYNGGSIVIEDSRRAEAESSANDPASPVLAPSAGPQLIEDAGPHCTAGPQSLALTVDINLSLCMPPDPEDPEPATVTPAHVRRAFARLPLPASTLVIQPPDGLTLVNFDTNFFTTSTTAITRQVTLLGRPVTIEATPSEYHWHFGDGQSLTTNDPGAPYPELTVTHNYLTKDTYRPRLDTVYTGRFRVAGGPWQTIPGTVTITGAPQHLRAIAAQPKLVAPYGR